jgi:MoxR-like ATPase
MERGAVVRVEELTRLPSDVQDALITVLSEKTLPVPELGIEVQARHGFTLIATANDRDRGVNELSSALRRRFNTVVLPTPATAEEEVQIVTQRVAALGAALSLPPHAAPADEIRRVVSVFRELRLGQSDDGRIKLKTPSGTMSTAEAISVIVHGMAMAVHLGDGTVQFDDLLGGIEASVVRDPVHDTVVWREYLDSLAMR